MNRDSAARRPARSQITPKLLAWKIAGWGDRDVTMIWMDGRPHPSQYAPHLHGGFTTGAWEGDTLTTVTRGVRPQTVIKISNLTRAA